MFKVTVCEEHLQNSKIELEDIIQTTLTVKRLVNDPENIKLIEEMISQCPLEVVGRLSPYQDKDSISSKYSKGNYESLVALNAALKNQMLDTKRREVTYE
jgi:hypothetical protein